MYLTKRTCWGILFSLTILSLVPQSQAKPQAPPTSTDTNSPPSITKTIQKHDQSNQPIVVYSASTESSSAIHASVTAGEIAAGQPITISTIGTLGHATEDVIMTIDFPSNKHFVVDEHSVELTEILSTTSTSYFDASKNKYTWIGVQADAEGQLAFVDDLEFDYAGIGFDDLSDHVTAYVECASSCDEKSVVIDISAYGIWEYEGQEFTTLTFWENGLIEVGHTDVSTTWKLQELPNVTTPNGLLAPLWSDFEVIGGQGELRYNIYDDGADQWLIFEWHNVQEWGETSGANYTFNVWFRLNTSEVYFNYLDINAAGALGYGVIGLESSDGISGQLKFYNGSGDFPVDGQVIAAKLDEIQLASTQIDIDFVVPTFGAVGATAGSGIHSRAIIFDLTESVGKPQRDLVTELNISSGATSHDAELTVVIKPDGGLTVEVTVQPEHGSVSLDGMTATYTPDAGYVGTDSFSYRVVDASGATSTENTVSMTVTNATPTVTATAPETAENGDTVVLNASSAADADGDALTYSWVQTAGPELELSGADTAQASFTAPLFEEEDTDFGFTVTVSDGLASATSDVVMTVLADPNTAPVININAPTSVSADEIVRLDASGTTDAEDDTLTFNWQFAGGATVSLNNANTAVATFTAPRVFEEAQAKFVVTVSDGRATSQQMVTITIEPEEKSSGSMGWLFVLLALPLVWLRRSKG
jgi:hypothetical protein